MQSCLSRNKQNQALIIDSHCNRNKNDFSSNRIRFTANSREEPDTTSKHTFLNQEQLIRIPKQR